MADSGRADYDQLVDFRQLDPGEPFFLIRARDLVGAPTVRAWAAFASKAGAPPAIVESALQHADRLAAWPKKRLPDADHLTQAERLSLEYELARRAWNHRIAHAPNEAILLAEARGAAQAVARDRHADQLLADLVESLAPVLAKTTADPETKARAMSALQRVGEDLARRRGEPATAAEPTPAPVPMAEAVEGELVEFVPIFSESLRQLPADLPGAFPASS